MLISCLSCCPSDRHSHHANCGSIYRYMSICRYVLIIYPAPCCLNHSPDTARPGRCAVSWHCGLSGFHSQCPWCKCTNRRFPSPTFLLTAYEPSYPSPAFLLTVYEPVSVAGVLCQFTSPQFHRHFPSPGFLLTVYGPVYVAGVPAASACACACTAATCA